MVYVDDNGYLNLSKLHEPQKEFIRSTTLNTGLIGGYQSGKSVAGTVKVLTKLLKNPTVPCAYYLPTYRLIEDMLVPKFENLFQTCGIPYVHLKQDSSFITKYGKVMMRSLDNPSSIVSYSVGYSLVDEFDLIPNAKMKVAHGRIVSRNSYKSPSGEPNSIDFVSTPEGFGFAYNYFVKNINENRKLIKISTLDNSHNLADSYIQGLKEAYTETQLLAYLNGEFVNLTSGTVYREFDRKRHINNEKRANDNILYIGMDFNITNMAATISIKEGNTRYVVDEVVDAYDTGDMISILMDRYPTNRKIVYPDAAGNARNTSGKSDHNLLRKAGFKVIAPSKNPSVRDRVNSVNKAFSIDTIFVNENKCPSLVEALEKQAYNKYGEPDKQSGHDHVNDAFGYEVHNSKTNVIKKRSSNVF